MSAPEVTAKHGIAARLKFLAGGFRAMTRGFSAAVTGRGYEGALRDRRRGRPATRLESHDRSLDHGDREALISEARNLEQNVGLVGAIAQKYADGVVGRCELRWNTGDPDIDARYKEAWMDAHDTIDHRGEHDFCQLTKLVLGQGIFVEGDIFAQHMLTRSTAGRHRDYKVNLIEADRIGSALYQPSTARPAWTPTRLSAAASSTPPDKSPATSSATAPNTGNSQTRASSPDRTSPTSKTPACAPTLIAA
jgi:hypothetical protein